VSLGAIERALEAHAQIADVRLVYFSAGDAEIVRRVRG
jgi:hypothetical protein